MHGLAKDYFYVGMYVCMCGVCAITLKLDGENKKRTNGFILDNYFVRFIQVAMRHYLKKNFILLWTPVVWVSMGQLFLMISSLI